MPKAYLVGDYWHIVLKDYKKICIPETIRTHDVGRPHSNQRMCCVNKKTGKWITFSWHVHRSNVKVVKAKKGRGYTLSALNRRTEKILNQIRANFGRIRVVRKGR